MDKKIKRPILRYHGGKFKLAPWIISHFPSHKVYVEPFGGGGSVLLQKERSYAEVYNDKWDIVVNVFECLRNPVTAQILKAQLLLTPFSRTEFNKCGDIEIQKIKDPVERARRTILRSFAGFGSASTNAKHATGFRSNSNRSGTIPAHDWANYPLCINSFIERLSGVIIENRNYKEVMLVHDSKKTLHYLDPPYVHITRNMNRGNWAYACEMSDIEHEEMAVIAKKVEGFVVLSGYSCELYNDLFSDWVQVTKETHGDGAVDRTEILFLNKATVEALQIQKSQLKLF
jgi:DNA adenine methylase